MSLESTNRLSELTGMDVRTIKRRLATIQPTVQGRAHTYESRDALPLLYGAQDSAAFDLNQERARLAHHQANNEALKERTARGELIPRAVVIQAWQAMIAAARSRLLAIPTKAAHRLLAVANLAEAEDVVRSHVHEALAELQREAVPEPDLAGDEVGDGGVGAAADADGQPMGGPLPAPVARGQRGTRAVANRSRAVPARGDGRGQRPKR